MISTLGGVSPASGSPATNIPQYAPGTTSSVPAGALAGQTPTGYNTTGSITIPNTAPIGPATAPMGGNPVDTQTSVVNDNATRVAAAEASAKAYASSTTFAGSGNDNQAGSPDLSGTNTTSNSSDVSTGNSYSDLLNSISKNQTAYLQTAQQDQSEIDAQNNYLQAVQASQNFQQQLTAGELGQYGVGRPVSLDTGRAAQIGFNNQLTEQNYQNAATIAGQSLGYAQNARQIRTQAASTALGQQTTLAGLEKPQVVGNQLINPTTGQPISSIGGTSLPTPADITSLATAIFQNGGAADFGSAYQQAQQILAQQSQQQQQSSLSPAQQSSLQNNGSTTATMSSGNTMGYDLSQYASDPNYESEVSSHIQDMPSSMTTASSIQSYIDENYKGSPITGNMIMASSSAYGVSTKVLTGILAQESQMGTDGSAGAKGNNPGNWDNTDSAMSAGGSGPVKFASVQDGVNHVAQWLSQHPAQQTQQSQTQQLTYQALQSVLPTPLSGALSVLSDGTPYFEQSKIPSENQQLASVYEKKYNIALLDDGQVGKAQNIDTLTQKINQMIPLISSALSGSTAGSTAKNFLNNLPLVGGGNQQLNQLNSYNTAAISAIENIVGGSGSGVRVTGAEINLANSLVPNGSDSVATAQTKLASLQSQINEWRNEYFTGAPLPATFGQIQSQIQGQGGQQVSYQGQTYNVDANGDMTLAQ